MQSPRSLYHTVISVCILGSCEPWNWPIQSLPWFWNSFHAHLNAKRLQIFSQNLSILLPTWACQLLSPYSNHCWDLPSSPFMPSLSLRACSSSLYLSYAAPSYFWLHLVFFQVRLGQHPPWSPTEVTRWSLAECSSARSVYTEGCHPPEDPPKPFSSKEKVLSQTSDLARSL